MWLFHANKKTKQVRGGEQFVQRCPSCGEKSTFVEVEIEENMGVWFVDVIGDKERAFGCTSCQQIFDIKDDEHDAPALPQKSAAELAHEARVAEQKQLAAAKARKELAAAKAVRIEDELAELKKRLGR